MDLWERLKFVRECAVWRKRSLWLGERAAARMGRRQERGARLICGGEGANRASGAERAAGIGDTSPGSLVRLSRRRCDGRHIASEKCPDSRYLIYALISNRVNIRPCTFGAQAIRPDLPGEAVDLNSS